MKSVIVYCSSHGTTAKAAQLLGDRLEGNVDLVDLIKNKEPNLAEYDSIIIGGSIHAGLIQRKVKQCIKNNHDLLSAKKVGFFLCCFREGEEAKTQFENAFPQDLRDQAKATGLFGGEFIFANMNFVERLIVKKVASVAADQSTFNIDSINKFAEKFNQVS